MINPVAFEIGYLQVRWYGIILAAAFLTGTILAYRRAHRSGADPEHIINLITLIIPAAIIGARLYYVIFSWSDYRDDPLSALAIWHGGLAIHGGIIGGVLVGLWYTRRHRLPLWNTADILAPSLIIGQAIGRWGNFINQEAHGGPVSESFINMFPGFIKNQMFIDGQYYQPTFLYESVWDFAVFLFLTYYWGRRKVPGEVALLYLILYSTGRLVVEGLRTDSLMLGPVRVAQLVSLALIIAGSLLFHIRRKRKA
ncbi:MAG: diacylglyceryl transferase [Peptococcaceae bacterium BICA1-7]|nr:MAG: diacylglyceryl transferase [Peptococcaceae bacterium BICA1-7]HBV97026.1 prolipoprotein diacylglyceryl transferase [Desulfotomaculum sp.]